METESWLCACVCSVAHSCLWDPMTVACQAPLSMGFSKQEYWSRLPFPFPGDLPDPRTEPTFPVSPTLGGRFFTVESPGKPRKLITYCLRLKGSWEWGMTAVWWVIFGGWWKCSTMDCGDDCTTLNIFKNHWRVPFKCMHSTMCELHLNKAVEKKMCFC